MITLSYGFKKPQNPDSGDVWFPAMEANIQQLNDHNHDGTNSALLAAASTLPTLVLQNILSAAWTLVSGGLYRQLVTMPNSLQFDATNITMRMSNGNIIFAQIEKVSATTYYVYTNDNSQAFVAAYG